MKKLLCPSMMCANVANLQQEMQALEEANVDIYHIDVMDGTYVPNFGMGLQDIEYIYKSTDRLCDVHLMIQNPSRYIEKFIALGADIIYVHPESDTHITRTLQTIRDAGGKSGIAINPGTSYESIKDALYLVDYILVMTVNPGFAGQKYLDFVDHKLHTLCQKKDEYGYKIMIDGACSPEKVEKLSKIGVDGFILGTSALFGKGKDYKTIIQELRNL